MMVNFTTPPSAIGDTESQGIEVLSNTVRQQDLMEISGTRNTSRTGILFKCAKIKDS